MYLGDYPLNAVIDFKWDTADATLLSITRATNGTVRIYKNNSDIQRSSSNGIIDSEDFDGITGIHHCRIDLSDNTDAGFYAAGNEYQVVIQGMLLGIVSVNRTIGHFSIERAGGILATVKAIQTAVGVIDDYIDTEMAAVLSAVDTEVAAIKTATDSLVTDMAAHVTMTQSVLNAVDTEVAAIKSATDSMVVNIDQTIFNSVIREIKRRLPRRFR